MVSAQKMTKYTVVFLCLVFSVMAPLILPASGNWKKVAFTGQDDIWYVEQIVGFSSKESILAARARLKLVAGEKSAIGRSVKKGLLTDGVKADTFHYFVESVEVDCIKMLFVVSKIDFYDAEDSQIFGQTFAEPKKYPSTPGSAFEIIMWDLCQNRPNPFTALKKTFQTKKPFLYFYP